MSLAVYNLDGEELTEDEVLTRIKLARSRREALAQALEHKEKERWYWWRNRFGVYAEDLTDMADAGTINPETLRRVIRGLTGVLMEST